MQAPTAPMPAPDRTRIAVAGLVVMALAFFVYWICARGYNALRGDFFYLADAFLNGRTWLQFALGPQDVIDIGGRIYVPFAPFPAIVLAPIVALVGPVTADSWEPAINALLAASVVGLAWWVAGRIGVPRLGDRVMLVVLLGFSTQVWWVTTRGGVWHTGQLVAMVLTMLLLGELFGRRRAMVLGLLVGAAFLSRAPLAFAGPAIALWFLPAGSVSLRGLPWRSWAMLIVGFLPALAFFLGYNAVRFGSPFESGYGLATLNPFLQAQRDLGLFSPVHIPMNLEYLLVKLPAFTTALPFLIPDGYGMSVLFTSPGLLLGLRADWRDRRSWILALAAGLVLVPTLLYYGGGWLQFGYRYFLDSIPFVWALVALGIVHRGPLPWWGRALIWFGVLVMATSVYWAYQL